MSYSLRDQKANRRDHQATVIELPPSMARVFRVAAGLAQWTLQEQAWLQCNPRWLTYERNMREALAAAKADIDDSSDDCALALSTTLREDFQI